MKNKYNYDKDEQENRNNCLDERVAVFIVIIINVSILQIKKINFSVILNSHSFVFSFYSVIYYPSHFSQFQSPFLFNLILLQIILIFILIVQE